MSVPEPQANEVHDGTIVAQLRRAARLSQERLAELTGLSIRSIRGIERGAVRRPHLHTLAKIADGLGLPAHERVLLAEAFGHTADSSSIPGLTPAELPRDLADFVGRGTELRAITDAVGRSQPARTAVPVVVISGRGGAGKTTLALRAAHQHRNEYPDGQLFASLAGPSGVGATPGDALVDLLTSLGLDASRMPPSHEARVRAFRSLTSDRRYLIVLDNVTDARGLEDLLPVGPGNAVIVTSRPELTEIAPTVTVRLGACTAAEAVTLLRSSAEAGERGDGPETEQEWADLARECTYLPLALRVAGSRLAARPDWGPLDLLGRLSGSANRLRELRHGARSVDEAIETSFEALPSSVGPAGLDPAESMLRLGLLPTTDFSTNLAAEVLGCTAAEADDVIGALQVAQLLGAGPDRRHSFHDLVRDFAEVRAAAYPTRIDPASTYDALGRYLRRNLERAGDLGVVRYISVGGELRPYIEDAAGRAVYERWLAQEFPSMRDYVTTAAGTPGADLDIVVAVAMPLVELCDMRTDLATAWHVTTCVAEASRRAERWLYFAWAQGHRAYQASMRNDPDADQQMAATEQALVETDPAELELIHIQLNLARGVNAGFLARYEASVEYFREGLRLLGSARRPVRVLLMQNLAESMIRTDRPREAIRYLTRDPDLMAQMGWNIRLRSDVKIAKCLNLMGSYAEALASATRTFHAASEAQFPAVAVAVSVEVARALVGLDQSAEACRWAEESIARAEEMHRPDLAEGGRLIVVAASSDQTSLDA